MMPVINSSLLQGWHSELSERDSGAVNVIATHETTGRSYNVTVQTRGPAGELEALQEIARRVGLADM